MWWNKKQKVTLKSDEFLELKSYLDKLRLQMASLELDLQLYTKKLRATKGLDKKEKDDDLLENEKFNNSVILPS